MANGFPLNELPHDISASVISDFLEVKDLVNLDTAVLNRSSRPALLSLFSRDNVSLLGLRDATLHLSPYLTWMHSRCLRVREVAINEKQWIDLLHGLWYRSTEQLEKLMVIAGHFEQIGPNLDQFRFPIVSLIRFHHLKVLRLHRLSLAPLCAPLASCCPFLTDLELVGVQVSVADQEFLLSRGPLKIHHLRLEDINQFTLQAAVFPVLRSLEIVCLRNSPIEIITFIHQQNSLRRLTLQPDRSGTSNFDFTSTHVTKLLIAIAKFHLVYLQLHDVAELGDRSFASAMYTNAQSLEYLNLEHCNRISGETTTMLIERCKDLKNLNFCGTSVTDEGIIGLINGSTGLEYLDVSNSCELSDTVLATLNGSVFRGLNVECCPKMSDDGLIRMIYRCPSLESLNIRGTGNRGNYDIPNAEMTSLITGRSFHAIAHHAHNLTELITGHNPFVTMAVLQNLLQFCPRLTKLEVTRLRDPAVDGGGHFELPMGTAAAAAHQMDVDDMDIMAALGAMPPYLPMMPPHHPHAHQQHAWNHHHHHNQQQIQQQLHQNDLPHFMPDLNRREEAPRFRPSPEDAPRFNRIRKLTLKMVNVREEELMMMLQRCVNLRELRLLRVGRLTRRGIRHLLSVLPKLVLLDVTGFAASLLDMKHMAALHGFVYDEPARSFRR